MKRENGLSRWGWALLGGLAAVYLGLWVRAFSLERNAPDDRPLAEALSRGGWRDALWETAGLAALSAGEPDAAVEYLEQAAQLEALSASGALGLGDAYRALGDWTAAIENWERALEGGHDPIPARRRLLEAHRTLGDYAAAIEDLRALTALDPGNPAAHYQLGLLLAAREPGAALASLLQAAELDENLIAAVRLLQAGLKPDPGVDDPAFVYFNAGRALAGLGEWTLAAEAFRQALLSSPGYADAWAFMGEAMFHLGRDGGEMLETALELDPESLTANLLKALQLRREGRPAEALVYLERAAAIAPEEPAVAAETAQVYTDLGEVNKAIEYFLLAVELAPEDPTYLHLLAMFSIYNELQIDEIGLPAARSAVLMDPRDPVALDLIGYAYYLGGDSVSGMRFLYRALGADPNYAPARLHLGMLFLARADPAAARRQLKLALQLAPDSPAGRQAQEILNTYLPY